MKISSFKRAVMLFLALVAITWVFYGCTPEKRLHRLLLKHPELLKEKVTSSIDTIIKTDTIFIPSVKDSFIITTDTIIRTRNFEVQKVGPRFFISSPPDTFVKHDSIFNVIIVKEKIETKKSDPLGRLKDFIIGFIILVIIGSITYAVILILRAIA